MFDMSLFNLLWILLILKYRKPFSQNFPIWGFVAGGDHLILNPSKNRDNIKTTFGFKSRPHPQQHSELDDSEREVVNIVKSIKLKRFPIYKIYFSALVFSINRDLI